MTERIDFNDIRVFLRGLLLGCCNLTRLALLGPVSCISHGLLCATVRISRAVFIIANVLFRIHFGNNLANHLCRIARYNSKGCHILGSILSESFSVSHLRGDTYLGHHTSGPNGCSLSNAHAGQNHHISANPAIFLNMDFLPHFWASSARTNSRV